MPYIAILLNGIIGGFWRHTLGGWNGPFNIFRGTWLEKFTWAPDDKGVIQPRRTVILMLGWLLSWPLWVLLPWWQALIGTVLCDLFWRFGHKVDSWKVWLRYGPFAAPWVLAKKWWGKRPERAGDFLNNWMACGEFGAGVLFWAFIAALTLLG